MSREGPRSVLPQYRIHWIGSNKFRPWEELRSSCGARENPGTNCKLTFSQVQGRRSGPEVGGLTCGVTLLLSAALEEPLE